MITCQVDAWFSAMRKEDVERELEMLVEVLDALDGEFLGAEVGIEQGRILAYVRTESELVVHDIFEVFHFFTVERIACLGQSHETQVDFDRPASPGAWQYRPARAAGQAAIRRQSQARLGSSRPAIAVQAGTEGRSGA